MFRSSGRANYKDAGNVLFRVFQLDRSVKETLQAQLGRQLTAAIRGNAAQLPPSRVLANFLGISKNVVGISF